MRKIKGLPVFLFFSMITFSCCLSVILIFFLNKKWQIWQISEALTLAFGFISFTMMSLLFYRTFFKLFPLPEGEIKKGTTDETLVMIYQLFIMLLWRPIFQNRILPVPMSRLVYKALGSKVGNGTYFPGTIGDPLHFSIGNNSILGDDSLVIAHAIEGTRFAFYPVAMGNNVTIGAKSIIMAGVHIGDGAIVAAGSIVPKHTQILAGEVWAGTPAKCISRVQEAKFSAI